MAHGAPLNGHGVHNPGQAKSFDRRQAPLFPQQPARPRQCRRQDRCTLRGRQAVRRQAKGPDRPLARPAQARWRPHRQAARPRGRRQPPRGGAHDRRRARRDRRQGARHARHRAHQPERRHGGRQAGRRARAGAPVLLPQAAGPADGRARSRRSADDLHRVAQCAAAGCAAADAGGQARPQYRGAAAADQ